ncbi:MAG: YlmC/YmxH family sporulation protein [Clostridioides sp.]|jgi:YlmC/YmxH family sporulation protein|nr:YlmC/YmxH family sporulation protein [Clostridioides sp.]
MILSEIAGKEIVNLVTGERLGEIGDCDMILDEETGSVLSLLIPQERGFFRRKDGNFIEVPWKNIRKIGNDMIIIEHEGSFY